MKSFSWVFTLSATLISSLSWASADTKSYYITLKKDKTNVERLKAGTHSRTNNIKLEAEKILNGSNGKLRRTFKYSAAEFSAELSPSDLTKLRKNPKVSSIQEVPTYTSSGLPNNNNYSMQTDVDSWAIDRVDQREGTDRSYEFNRTGRGVNIYIIDNGINSHEEFGQLKNSSPTNRLTHAWHAPEFPNGEDCTTSDYTQGHGTPVAAVAAGVNYGVAKEANIHSLRVGGCDKYFNGDNVVKALEWLKDNIALPAVVNMSFSGGYDSEVEALIRDLSDDGVIFVAAASNADEDKNETKGSDLCTTPKYPALYSDVIAVAAIDKNDQKPDFSYYGACVDIFAPGAEVLTASATGFSASTAVDGTSFASPIVAGIAAMYLQDNPTASPAAFKNKILREATYDKLANIGDGSPNTLAFTNLDFDGPEYDNAIDSTTEYGFETSLELFNKGQFNWIRKSGNTPSGNTGPNSGENSDYYAYVETSSGHAYEQDDTAILVSDYFIAEEIGAIEFSYHMYGADIGELYVEIQNYEREWEHAGILYHQKQRSSTEPWKKYFSFDPLSKVDRGLARVRFRVKAFGGWKGDVALDNIRLIKAGKPDSPTITSPAISDSQNYKVVWDPTAMASYYQTKVNSGSWTSVDIDDEDMDEPQGYVLLNSGTNSVYVRACNSYGCGSAKSITVSYSSPEFIESFSWWVEVYVDDGDPVSTEINIHHETDNADYCIFTVKNHTKTTDGQGVEWFAFDQPLSYYARTATLHCVKGNQSQTITKDRSGFRYED